MPDFFEMNFPGIIIHEEWAFGIDDGANLAESRKLWRMFLDILSTKLTKKAKKNGILRK